jgi:hypothetical protein
MISGTKTAGNGGTNQTSYTTYRPQDEAALDAQRSNLAQQTAGVTGLTQQLQQQAAQRGTPQLATRVGVQQFTPTFNNNLDPLARQMVSQGTQGLNAQASTQAQQLQRSLAGDPRMAAILGRQAGMNARMQSNPLLFQAAMQQGDREAQRNAAGLAATQANNGANLSQFQAQNQALGQQQALDQGARQEQLGYGQASLNANQALLSSLSQMMSQFGTQHQQGSSSDSTRAGGMLQNFGIK